MFSLLTNLQRRVDTALLENAQAAARLVDITSRFLTPRSARAPSHHNGKSNGIQASGSFEPRQHS